MNRHDWIDDVMNSTLAPSARHVAHVLYRYMDERCQCFPGVAKLVEKTGLNRKTVMRVIREIEQAGFLSVNRKKGGRNEYTGTRQTSPMGGTSTAEGTSPMGGTRPVPLMGPDQSHGRDYNKPLNQPSNKPKRKKRKQEVEIPDWLPSEKWASFVAHRKAIRKPLTEDATRLIVKKLSRFRDAGHNPVAVLETTIENGWTGVFEPKEKPREASNNIDDWAQSRIAKIHAAGQPGSHGGSNPNPFPQIRRPVGD